jgi:DNA-binding transcriptional regulator YiaG
VCPITKKATPELHRLFKRVRAHTKRNGALTELADFLGVSLSTLSDWLRGRFEPGGEITLRMLKWVERSEVKRKTPVAR